MKFGLINCHKIPYGRENANIKDTGIFNVGDNIQMIAIKRLYLEVFHINEDEIVEIDYHELASYTGEYLIVIVNFFFFGCHDMKEKWFPASPYIIPVFIGVHFSSKFLSTEEQEYFRRYAPVGCRDEFTLSTMRNYGIESFLFGCITATFPTRPPQIRGNSIYLVDVDEEMVFARLSDTLKKYNFKIVHHVLKGCFSKEMYQNANQYAENLLRQYGEDATLVITSRLHCAAPCVAMGIPTIMIVKEKSQRFSWLANLIDIYSEEECKSIDWPMKMVDFRPIKTKMIHYVKKRVNEYVNKYSDITTVSSFFENKLSNSFVEPYSLYYLQLDEMLENGISDYYIWGGTALAEETIHHISIKNQNWKLRGIIDEYNEVYYEDFKSVSFEQVKEESSLKNIVFFITPTSSKEYIKDQLVQAGLSNCKALFADGTIIDF